MPGYAMSECFFYRCIGRALARGVEKIVFLEASCVGV